MHFSSYLMQINLPSNSPQNIFLYTLKLFERSFSKYALFFTISINLANFKMWSEKEHFKLENVDECLFTKKNWIYLFVFQ